MSSPPIRRALLSAIPDPVVGSLLSVRKRGRSVRYRVRERVSPVALGRDDVAAALRAAGLREGDGVFVHTAMSRFGRIEGGPAAIVGAIEDVIGERGLIAMPAFPMNGGTVAYLATDPVFDVRETPSRIGAVPEYFRRLPGVRRSLHPTHSLCARGEGADELLAGHAEAATPFGDGSPYARMIERGMHQLWLGTGIQTFTLYYAFECLKGDAFPFRVFSEAPMSARCIDAEGRERTVSTLVHDPALGRHKDKVRARMHEHLLATGVSRRAPLGRGEVLAARMPELMHELDALLGRGITVYDLDVAEAA